MARPETIDDIKDECDANPVVVMPSGDLDKRPEAQHVYAKARQNLLYHGMRMDDEGNVVREQTQEERESHLRTKQHYWDSKRNYIANYDGEEIYGSLAEFLTEFADRNGLECPVFNIKEQG